MDLKLNINKIHSDLTQNYSDVKISEKASLEFDEYIEISVANEGKELLMILPKRSVQNNKFVWSYYSNPEKKDFLVERTSTIEGMIEDVKDIFEKNRFDSEYLSEN